MAKVFLSHRSTDKELVRNIASQLGKDRCVLDEVSFEVGENTLEEIYKKLDSSDILVLFISEGALSSPWVMAEVSRSKSNIEKNMLDRIFPIIIDKNIKFSDHRIPQWIRESYNLKHIHSTSLILQKIKQAIRTVNFKNNRKNREIEALFIGRNNEMEKFETDICNLDNWLPNCFVAYSFYEGIGRRTFLRKALERSGLITKYAYKPIQITIDSKESIESFIYKLNSINPNESVVNFDFSKETLESKVNIAYDIVREYILYNEIIFVIDDGGIVLPNGQISDWFCNLVRLIDENTIAFCLISKFKPNELFLKKEGRYLSYNIHELNKTSTQNLFLKLLHVYNVEIRKTEDKEFFINHLTGIPAQIIYAVNMLDAGMQDAKKNINEIVEFNDAYSSTLLNFIRKDEVAYQIALFLSTNEIMSYSFIDKVFGTSIEVENAIHFLFDLSAFSFVLDGHEHIKLNPALSDYISRNNQKLDAKYKAKFDNVKKDLLKIDLDELVQYDYSAFLISINELLISKGRINPKYYVPSIILKYVVKQYEKGNYKEVIKICEELVQNSNFDQQILIETKNQLMLAYARESNDRFFDYICDFKNDQITYHFLKGFYFRFKKNYEDSLAEYNKVLEITPDHSRTKREIVNIYLILEKYDKALELAKSNYQKQKTNIYHIQSYFLVLVYSKNRSAEDNAMIEILLKEAEKLASNYQRANDIYACMRGDYQYAVLHNFNSAEAILKEALRSNENKTFPLKSLFRIYKMEKLDEKQKDLKLRYEKYKVD